MVIQFLLFYTAALHWTWFGALTDLLETLLDNFISHSRMDFFFFFLLHSVIFYSFLFHLLGVTKAPMSPFLTLSTDRGIRQDILMKLAALLVLTL